MIDCYELSKNENLRLWFPFVLPKINYNYDKLSRFISVCESGSRPKGGINDQDEGEAISLGGEQINVDGSVDLSKIPYVSKEFYDKTDRGKVKNSDILICKDGALTGKTCFVDFKIFPVKEVMVNEHVYILRANNSVSQKFLYYFTTTKLFQSQIKDLAYKKKAQPGLNFDHLKKIKIPIIPKPTQDQIVAKIEPIEQKIKELRNSIKPQQEVINRVFAREFGFDLDKFEELKKNRFFEISFNSFGKQNDLRFSVKNSLYSNFLNEAKGKNEFICFKKLLIEEPQYGANESAKDFVDGDVRYVRITDVDDFGNLLDENTKTAEKVEKKYLLKNNDFLFARSGNTVGKSFLYNSEIHSASIFAGYFIKFVLNTKKIYPLFLFYYSKSLVFEVWKNTVVRIMGQPNINAEEYKTLPIINVSLENQQKIVDEIKAELDAQEEIKKQIEAERNKIDDIIEKAIA